MRLFTAIQFDDETKSSIAEIQARLLKFGQKGNFTDKDNLHLTLIFIGETPASKVDSIKNAVDKADSDLFKIELGGFGRFKRDGGDIWWLGVKESKPLAKLYERLSDSLSLTGTQVDKRQYKPHLTLAREFSAMNNIDVISAIGEIPVISVAVNKLSLMKSERIRNKLVYTEIYAKKFKIANL